MRDFVKTHKIPVILSGIAIFISTMIALAPVISPPSSSNNNPQQMAQLIEQLSARVQTLEANNNAASANTAPDGSVDLGPILARLAIVEKAALNQSKRVTKLRADAASAADKANTEARLALLEKGIANQTRRVTALRKSGDQFADKANTEGRLVLLEKAALNQSKRVTKLRSDIADMNLDPNLMARVAILEKGILNQAKRVTKLRQAANNNPAASNSDGENIAARVAILEKAALNQSKRVTALRKATAKMSTASSNGDDENIAARVAILEKAALNQSKRVTSLRNQNQAQSSMMAALPKDLDRLTQEISLLKKGVSRINLRVAALKGDALPTDLPSGLSKELTQLRADIEALQTDLDNMAAKMSATNAASSGNGGLSVEEKLDLVLEKLNNQ